MSFAVGIFDLFAYALPGALQLSFISYLLARLHVVDLRTLSTMPSVLLVLVVIVGSFVLGHVSNPFSFVLDRLIPGWRRAEEDAQREFTARVPSARDRIFLAADQGLLRAAVELHDKDSVTEISRFQALALMLRNVELPLALALCATVVEFAAGPHRLLAACCAAVFAASLLGCVRESRKLRHWARMRTLEVCFWIPDIDDKLDAGHG